MLLSARTAFFHTAGYLRVPGLLDPSQVERLREVVSRTAANSDHPHVRSTSEKTRVDQVVSFDPAFLAVASSDRVLDTLAPVLGANIELVENRHNHLSIYRGPGTDRLHRDILQWSRSLLTVLVYLSDCTDLDSATAVVPGSHLWPCLGQHNNGGTWMEQVAPYASLCDQAVAVSTVAGDAVLMHGQLYHARRRRVPSRAAHGANPRVPERGRAGHPTTRSLPPGPGAAHPSRPRSTTCLTYLR